MFSRQYIQGNLLRVLQSIFLYQNPCFDSATPHTAFQASDGSHTLHLPLSTTGYSNSDLFSLTAPTIAESTSRGSPESCFFFFFFNCSIVDVQYYVSFRCITQWSVFKYIVKWSPVEAKKPSVTLQSDYIIIDYIFYVICYIPMISLFCPLDQQVAQGIVTALGSPEAEASAHSASLSSHSLAGPRYSPAAAWGAGESR